MDKEIENNYLMDLILAKGDIDNVHFESAEDKIKFIIEFNLQDKYKELQKNKIEILYEMNAQSNANKLVSLNSTKNDIVLTAENTLKSRDIDIPLLLGEKEKKNKIIEGLQNIGLQRDEIEDILKDGIKEIETIAGRDIIFTFSDNEVTKKILEKNNIQYNKTQKGLEVEANLIAQEGIELENNESNRKKLRDNSITYFIQPKSKNIFVPLRAKKLATFLVLSGVFMGGPTAILLQILLNKTKVLDKIFENNRLTGKNKEAVKNNQTILTKRKIDGKIVEQYVFKEKLSGKYKKINKEDVVIPNRIDNITLSPVQKMDLKNGLSINIETRDGIKKYSLDLNAPNGLREWKEMKNDENIKIPKPISADSEKLEYISKRGKSGLADIFGNNAVNYERDKFLDKNNLRTEFYNYNNAEKDVKLSQISGTYTNEIRDRFKEAEKSFMKLVGEKIDNKKTWGIKL